MKRKKLSLVLVFALLLPMMTVFGQFDSVHAADEAGTYLDTNVNLTIHTRNLSGLPIYDGDGAVISGVTAPANQDFAISVIRKNNASMDTFYEVAPGRFLAANEVIQGIPTMAMNYYHAVVHVVAGGPVQVYDGNGTAIAGISVAGDSAWYTNQQAIDLNSGVTYYQISPDRYVCSNDVDSFTGAA